jgi:hypothetical protein
MLQHTINLLIGIQKILPPNEMKPHFPRIFHVLEDLFLELLWEYLVLTYHFEDCYYLLAGVVEHH